MDNTSHKPPVPEKITVLYFGSFNPFHIGHAAIAKYVATLPWVEQLWFVLSPKNPIKDASALEDPQLRWEDLQRVVKRLTEESAEEISQSGQSKFYACDIEFHLQPPLYTFNTLEELCKLHPDKKFALLMGGDNIEILHKWYRGMEIMERYPVLVYPRKGVDTESLCKKYGAIFIDAPMVDISSTQIREMQERGEDVSQLRY